jgi:hypothetical protein
MRIVFASLMLLMVAGARGTPATQPATAAAYPADTPVNALRSLRLALRDGDAAAISDLFIARDASGTRLIGAMADNAAAIVELHQAAEKAFGADGANLVTGDIKAESLTALAAIEKAEIKFEGGSATVKYPGATDAPIKLMKTGGKWRIPVTQLLDNADRAAEERGTAELSHQAALARQMASEIAAGQIREGASRAKEIWRSRLLAPATSGPATKPS